MRLFTGIALPPNVLEKLAAATRELQSVSRAKWSPDENLHITSKFIGQWPDDRLDELKSVLGTVATVGAISITVSRFGFLPDSKHPHVFYAGVQAGPDLAALAKNIGEALVPLGLPEESRSYQPHVTLARVKPNDDIRPLRAHVARMSDLDFGKFDAREFHLYLSASVNGGTAYTKLATYDLK